MRMADHHGSQEFSDLGCPGQIDQTHYVRSINLTYSLNCAARALVGALELEYGSVGGMGAGTHTGYYLAMPPWVHPPVLPC